MQWISWRVGHTLIGTMREADTQILSMQMDDTSMKATKKTKKRAVCGGWPSSVVLTMHGWQFEASLCCKLLNLHFNIVCCKPISYIFRVFATQVLRPLSTQHLWVSDPLQLHKQGVAHSLTGKTCFSGRPRCVSLVFFSFMPSSGFCVPDNTSREKTGSAATIYNSTMQRAEPCIACFFAQDMFSQANGMMRVEHGALRSELRWSAKPPAERDMPWSAAYGPQLILILFQLELQCAPYTRGTPGTPGTPYIASFRFQPSCTHWHARGSPLWRPLVEPASQLAH